LRVVRRGDEVAGRIVKAALDTTGVILSVASCSQERAAAW
jgi:hypothetical protein